jgi:hypothetical protein
MTAATTSGGWLQQLQPSVPVNITPAYQHKQQQHKQQQHKQQEEQRREEQQQKQ